MRGRDEKVVLPPSVLPPRKMRGAAAVKSAAADERLSIDQSINHIHPNNLIPKTDPIQ